MRADLVEQLFDEWAACLARGERPDPRSYLERAGDEKEELALLMDAYLIATPRSQPDPETLALVEAVMRGDSPLTDLRVRRGLTRDAVVDALLAKLALPPEKRPFLKRRYHDLEAGLLAGSGLSSRLVDALAALLRTSEGAIRTWRPRRLEAAAAFRMAPADAQLWADAVEDHDEEVDALFLSSEGR